jgi:hypothetical protein
MSRNTTIALIELSIQGLSKRDLQRYSKCYCWRVLQKHLYLHALHHSTFERWTVCTPVSVNVFVTLATQ